MLTQKVKQATHYVLLFKVSKSYS